jgi:RNA polymerase sigma factor (sigma-70 family)
MTTNQSSPAAIFDDAECVRLSLAGNKEAFGKIVAQYQSLICSLTYSATGSLRESEDVAQETFLIAWRQLKELREAEKLRPWLCGITRNLISNTLRRQEREPTHEAETLEDVLSVKASEASPSEAAINSEEAAILWRSLERIPELYREPLILFYREQHSTERVAAALDLSEETARQRLSRGRKLLQEEVTAFVEGALQRSAPGSPFTAGVLSALPIAASSAAATVFATSGKGAGMAKTTVLGLAGVFVLPVALLSGLYLALRGVLDSARSDTERKWIKKALLRGGVIGVIGIAGPFLLLGFGANSTAELHPWAVVAAVNLAFVTMPTTSWLVTTWARRQQALLATTIQAKPLAAITHPRKAFVYRSRISFLGLPLVNLQFTRNNWKPAHGWIAGGSRAIGGLFAFGGVAIAPVAFGSQAFGVIAVGGYAVGLFAGGCYALGAFAWGVFAEGWEATGNLVVGWKAAAASAVVGSPGGTAVAREFASGATLHALHAGDAAARQFFSQELFYRTIHVAGPFVGWGACAVLVPLAFWAARARRLRKSEQAA